MRKTNPANALFTPIKQEILAATYGQPDRWWYLSELASFAGKTPSSLQRELKTLAASGILRTRRDGSRLYFQAETRSPLFEPLRVLIDRSLGVIENLRTAMEARSELIDVAFVYGSVARGEDTARSDVDVLTVGKIGQADLTRVLRPLEARFGRDFNAKCYTTEEFRLKLENGNHFIASVMEERKIFIVGNEDDLAGFRSERLDT